MAGPILIAWSSGKSSGKQALWTDQRQPHSCCTGHQPYQVQQTQWTETSAGETQIPLNTLPEYTIITTDFERQECRVAHKGDVPHNDWHSSLVSQSGGYGWRE